jgi:hypothetical protein
MTATREHGNAIKVEQAVGLIAGAIDGAILLVDLLSGVLPDDYPTGDVRDRLEGLRLQASILEGMVQ